MEAAPPGFMVKRGARGKTSTELDRSISVTSQSSTPAAAPAAAAQPPLDDTPFGFERLPAMSSSVAAFQRRCEWFYVDPSGEEHGPVPMLKIIAWYKKGHFPDEVKVRCRSPWFAVGPMVKSYEEGGEVDTPTAAALARSGSELGSFLSGAAGLVATGSAALAPPPPPPPRTASLSNAGWVESPFLASAVSSSAGGGSGSASGAADLEALFVGDSQWSNEPVWYYFDRSDQVQGPFSAREMIGWVKEGMFKEDTKMCGAEPKLGIPPGRNLYQPLCDLLAMVKRGELYRPANLDTLRRKAPPAPAGPPPTGGATLNSVGSQPPPPPPPRRQDSSNDAYTSTGFGPPGRASDAPTWRKDVIPPVATSNAGSSNSSSKAGSGSGTAGAGAAGTAAIAASPGGAASAGSMPPKPGSDSGTNSAQAEAAPPGSGARSTTGSETGQASDDGRQAANYHSSNAAALSAALAPDQDFEYGEDFKRQRQANQTGRGAAGAGISRDNSMSGKPRVQDTGLVGFGDNANLGSAPSGGVGGQAAAPASAPANMAGVLGTLQQQVLQHPTIAPNLGVGLSREQVQALQAQIQQKQQLAAALAVAAGGAAGLQGIASGTMQKLPGGHIIVSQGSTGGQAPGGVPASAPIALATAAGGLQGVPPSLAVQQQLMHLQLQQQQQGPGSASGPVLANLPGSAQQQQQQQPGQQQPVGTPTSHQQLIQMLQSGQLQPQQLAGLLQQPQPQLQQQQQQSGGGSSAAIGHMAAMQQQIQQLQQQQQIQQMQQQKQQLQQQFQQHLQAMGHQQGVPVMGQAYPGLMGPASAAGSQAPAAAAMPGNLGSQGSAGVLGPAASQQGRS